MTPKTSTLKGTIATGPATNATDANDIDIVLDADSIPDEMNGIGDPDSDTSTGGTTAGSRVTTSVTITVHASRLLDDGMVTFSVEGDGAGLKSGLATGTSLTATAAQARSGDLNLVVTGLPENDTDPFRVIVKAEYSGSTGSLTLENDETLVRRGPLANVTAITCGVDEDNDDDNGCPDGYEPRSLFAPEDMILVEAEITDSIGSEVARGCEVVGRRGQLRRGRSR